MIWNIVAWIVFGLFAGAIARLLVPGRDPMGCLATIGLGILGSLIGGFLAMVLWGGRAEGFHPSGLLGAVIGAIILLLLWRWLQPRTGVEP